MFVCISTKIQLFPKDSYIYKWLTLHWRAFSSFLLTITESLLLLQLVSMFNLTSCSCELNPEFLLLRHSTSRIFNSLNDWRLQNVLHQIVESVLHLLDWELLKVALLERLPLPSKLKNLIHKLFVLLLWPVAILLRFGVWVYCKIN